MPRTSKRKWLCRFDWQSWLSGEMIEASTEKLAAEEYAEKYEWMHDYQPQPMVVEVKRTNKTVAAFEINIKVTKTFTASELVKRTKK